MKKKNNFLLLWKDILDLGVSSSLAFLKKKKNKKEALKELKMSFHRESQDHWQRLCETFKKLE